MILSLLSWPFVRIQADRIRIQKLCKASQYDDALLYQYRRLLQTFIRKRQMADQHPTLRDFDKWLQTHQERFKDLDESDIRALNESLQYAAFAKQKIGPDQYENAAQILKKLAKGMQRKKN